MRGKRWHEVPSLRGSDRGTPDKCLYRAGPGRRSIACAQYPLDDTCTSHQRFDAVVRYTPGPDPAIQLTADGVGSGANHHAEVT